MKTKKRREVLQRKGRLVKRAIHSPPEGAPEGASREGRRRAQRDRPSPSNTPQEREPSEAESTEAPAATGGKMKHVHTNEYESERECVYNFVCKCVCKGVC